MRRRSSPEAEAPQPSTLPVLNVMFLLIPALLLAMEVASFAAVEVSSPMFTNSFDAPAEPRPDDPPPPPPRVRVASDGFTIATREARHSAPYEQRIAGHDFAELAALMAKLHSADPRRSEVIVSGEGDVDLGLFVRTLDTLRGDGCSLAGVHHGETASPECRFWQVTVEAV